jgi:NAD(P)-dependent dehydrogenase (short-subunit alcohol dehydrogenase family)
MIPSLIDRFLDATIVLGFSSPGLLLRRLPPVTDRMDGRRVVVTGATGGIGRAAAEGLVRLGAEVVAVGRDPDKLAELTRWGAGAVQPEQADLGLMSEVRALARRLAERFDRLDVLVNNVGVLFPQRRLTAEGLEATFATNLLGQYLLTESVLPLLERSAGGRIITVSSGGMYSTGLEVDDLQNERSYRGSMAYARTKRAQVVLAEIWAERLAERGVVSHSMHPGWADTPGVRTSLPAFRRVTAPILRSPAEGADTIVWLAAAPEPGVTTGRFWHDRAPRPTHRLRSTVEAPGARERLVAALDAYLAALSADTVPTPTDCRGATR